MPRFRRYRVFLIFAAVVTFTLYNFWQTTPEDGPSRASFGGSRSTNVKPEKSDQNGSSGKESVEETLAVEPEEDEDKYWKRQTEHYPIPTESLIHLPTGVPKKMPRIQYEFSSESAQAKTKREWRQDKVRKEFLHAWNGYKKHAWGHDEVKPVTGGARDPFCGWSATMVDALDTLWIMGLKDEFEEALVAVEKINFTTSRKSSIPVFETTIRYLGGLLAAYDISGAKYPILLDKATELGEILMGVFDTPNRMPVLHYAWQPSFASEPHRASSNSNFAELGSLSLEFTRLAQLTGKHKYYDAVARITDALVEWQTRGTGLKGVFPEYVDASGCNATYVPTVVQPSIEAQNSGESKIQLPQQSASTNSGHVGATENSDEICRPQGLIGKSHQTFSMGGGQDSTYEYFSKMWLLLGGLDMAYRTLYVDTMDAIRTHMLYRPYIPGDRNALFSAKVTVTQQAGGEASHEKAYEVTHLTCFIGGMVGMGSKLFGFDEDLSIAERLTDGCVWAYEATRSGIMPEDAQVFPCENPVDCPWDEEQYYKYLDPRWEDRDKEIEEYDKQKAKTEKQYIEKESQAKLDLEEARLNVSQAESDHKARNIHVVGDVSVMDPPVDDDTTSYSLGGSAIRSDHEPEPESLAKSNDAIKENANADTEQTASSNITATVASESELRLANRDAQQSSVPNQTASSPNLDATERGLNDTSTGDALPILPDVPPTKTIPHTVPQNRRERDSGSVESQRSDPYRPYTHKEYIADLLAREEMPLGFARFQSDKYILRPEAIESVFYMHRITGAEQWAEKGWTMFEAIIAATRTEHGHSAVRGVNKNGTMRMDDSMESFWLAETLKYFYLLYSEPEVVSLDEWVLNTEAHPFKRPT